MFYVFDSGIGGITILNELKKVLPTTNFTYICDEKDVRYGYLSQNQLEQKLENVLKKINSNDQLFIACNTLSVVYQQMNKTMPNVYTMIELYQNIPNINEYSLLATDYTVRSNYLNDKFKFKSQVNGQNLASEIEHFQIKLVNQIINSIKEDKIILGCTHYELFKNYFPMEVILLSEYVSKINYKCDKNQTGKIVYAGPDSMKEQFEKFYAITNGFIVATTNQGKLREIQSYFPFAVSLNQINYYKDVEEPFQTLEENAKQKLNEYSKDLKFNLLVDDSGIFVNQLDGIPGVNSARYSGENATDQNNIDKLLRTMDFTKDTSAYFKTVLFATYNEKVLTSEGIVKGNITPKQLGTNGFGYSPIFIPLQSNKTHAQMSNEEKMQFSHRKLALEDLANQIKE
jgi:XTP/dITP diphosphohydrolase